MKIQEIKAKDLKPKKFIDEKVREIREMAGDGIAISALSGGVDSSVVTALAHKALGKKLKTYFIDNGIMREGEPRKVKALFAELGIPVTIVDARKAFFDAMKGITDPELKREAITQTFYKKVFRDLVLKSKATVLLQGTILTDVEETAAGIKRQHNVFEQIGIDPKKAFGYKISEPLVQLRKDGVRKVGMALGLQKSLFDRIPFPGPALAARVIGEVTPMKIALVRKLVRRRRSSSRRSSRRSRPSSTWRSSTRTASRACAPEKGISGSRSRSAAGTASMPERPRRQGFPGRRSSGSQGRFSTACPAW